MSEKITLSREQVEKCLRDALIIRFSTDSHVEVLRAALADPVPPAGSEPEQVHTSCRSEEGVTVGLVDTMINCARLLNGRSVTPAVEQAIKDLNSDEDVAKLVDRAQVTRLQAELKTAIEACDAYGVQVVELRAEVAELNDEIIDHRNYTKACREEREARQSELTKAREALQEIISACCDENSHGYISMVAEDALSNQSAPADKGQAVVKMCDCNQGRLPCTCRAADKGRGETPNDDKSHPRFIAGYTAGLYDHKLSQGEPVAWAMKPGLDRISVNPKAHEAWKAGEANGIASMVMPDFDTWYVKNRGVIGTAIYKNERKVWNACLDELARLNPIKQ